MFNYSGRSSFLKKCLSTILICLSVLVLCTIIYLESTLKKENADDEIMFFSEANIQEEKLLNLTNFRYIIKSNICGVPYRNPIETIVIVTSYAGDIQTRNAIRRAFPAKVLDKFGVYRVFLLALIDESRNYFGTTQKSIENENKRFGDIIQGNFYEGYRNLTYKHLMGLRWTANYCPQAKYIIKMDHDIIFDFYRLNFLLKKLPHVKHFLAGYVLQNMKPIRKISSKWYVTKQEYSRSVYPNFLSGWFYITTPKVADKLIRVSNKVKYFWIDDLYVTGLLVEKTNVTLVNLNQYYAVHSEYLKCCTDAPNYLCDYLIGPSSKDNKLYFKFQRFAEGCFYKNCKKRKPENSVKSTCINTWPNEPFDKGHAYINAINLS